MYIAPGEFIMGSDPAEIDAAWGKFKWKDEWKEFAKDEYPSHCVRVDGFWMYRHDVTNRQFQKFVQSMGYRTDAEKDGYSIAWTGTKFDKVTGADWQHPSGPSSSLTGKFEYPVVHVSWNDAKAYCAWAKTRLPYEGEWEYAARGGNTGLGGKSRTTFVWGNDYPTGKVANVADESAKRSFNFTYIFDGYDDGYDTTSPVHTFVANGFGLFDMAGNVWQWCEDWYGEDYYRSSPPVNPRGPSAGQMRVLRGGSWCDSPYNLRVASRTRLTPDFRVSNDGFRCAQSP